MTFKKPKISKVPQIKTLEVVCTATSCSDDLHCFKANKKIIEQGKKGSCRGCGVEIVDWERLHRMDIKDAEYTFDMLEQELVRHVFLLNNLEQGVINYTLRAGRVELRKRATKVLKRSVGNAQNFREGIQTPKKGNNVIHYAQHATASCCRKCIEYWHGIPIGRELTGNELGYLTELIMQYVERRMEGQNLLDEPQKIPSIRKIKRVVQ